jgi:hypothetical protein
MVGYQITGLSFPEACAVNMAQPKKAASPSGGMSKDISIIKSQWVGEGRPRREWFYAHRGRGALWDQSGQSIT